MDQAAKWLTVASYAFVIIGIAWGGLTIAREERRLNWEKKEIARIHDEVEDSDARNKALRDSGIKFATWNDMLFDHQNTQLEALKYHKPSFKGAFAVTLLGAVLGLVGAVMFLLV